MRGRPSAADTFLSLTSLPDAALRRAAWRQAITMMAQHSALDGPPALDTVPPAQLIGAARLSLDTELIDDLDWIAAGPAAVALYEITTALPPGAERREFGKRVFQRVYSGAAGAFASVATRMAWGSVKHLESQAMRARVGLCFALPVGSAVNVDPLALALLANRERFQAWVTAPAQGPLPARRLAAVLLERAAREAVRRAQQGDPYPAEWLTSRHVRPSHDRLLSDREPLVWRHAAVARGLLSAAEPRLREEIDLMLDPGLSPTEWRRATVSLVACLCHDAESVLPQLKSLLNSELAKRHPGLLATCLLGLPPVIESDPEVAEDLLHSIALSGRADVAEGFAELLSDVLVPNFGSKVLDLMRQASRSSPSSGSPAFLSGAERTLLRRTDNSSVTSLVQRALVAFETIGALSARDVALEALDCAHGLMDQLEGLDPANSLLSAAPLFADLDAGALQRARLYDLLLLGRRPGEAQGSVPEMELLFERLGRFVLRCESSALILPPSSIPAPSPLSSVYPASSAAGLWRKRIITFLHLMDVQSANAHESATQHERVHRRIREAISQLTASLTRNPEPAVQRALGAALARCLDAAVREGVADPAELLLVVMDLIPDIAAIRVLVEGSTDPDMRTGLDSFALFLELLDDQAWNGEPRHQLLARGVLEFSRSLGIHGAYRGEAVRQGLLRLGRALDALAQARCLTDLSDNGNTAAHANWADELSVACHTLAKLGAAAKHRVFSPTDQEPPKSQLEGVELPELLGRAISSGETIAPPQLAACQRALSAGLAPPLQLVVRELLARLSSLSITAPHEVAVIPINTRRIALPDWLLPRRTIGGFYVLRALGAGGVSTVFVAKRVEERRDESAELYALKVPQYDPTTARSLSEHEFMEMFRDEAGALLSLPRNANLARFVTFDADAKPRPILVMELICGQSLEKLIRSRAISMQTAFHFLDGILAGIAAMHAAGIAHLDVKPSNVILREDNTPVLVDFGLSGRQLRPGCGTLEYCAPEVLGVLPEGGIDTPLPCDLYAFGACAYEVLTGELLFDAETEMALMSAHVAHDGWPPKLLELARLPAFKSVAVILAACLRRDPRARPSADATRVALRTAFNKLGLANQPWPLQAPNAQNHLSA